jgi:hypothetical protein
VEENIKVDEKTIPYDLPDPVQADETARVQGWKGRSKL